MNDWQTRHDYYNEVDSDALSLVGDYGVMPDEHGIHDAVHERADSAVIYYSDCDDILRFTLNRNAAFDQMGPDCIAGKESTSEVNTVLAYFAYSQDLYNALEKVDEDDAHAALNHVQCEACDEWHDTAEEAAECCEDTTEGGE